MSLKINEINNNNVYNFNVNININKYNLKEFFLILWDFVNDKIIKLIKIRINVYNNNKLKKTLIFLIILIIK